MSQCKSKDQALHIGHRRRLKEKFCKAPESFADYELIELLLFQVIPRRDVRNLAKSISKSFCSLNDLINSDLARLLEIPGVNEPFCLQLKILREIIGRIFHERIQNVNVISSWAALLDYLKFHMSCLAVEECRVLFLNKRNILIADEVMGIGTIDQTAVYPREIVKKSLFYGAVAIILVHNHPSGNSEPSNADIDLTTHIVNACKTINVVVHDHVIIARGNYYSFKSNMLL